MKVSGSAVLAAPRDQVWAALNDPAVLVRTIPGCRRLEAVGDDTYRLTVTAGVASVKGVYQGQVALTDQQPLDSFVLSAAGSGAPGTVSARVLVGLADHDGTSTTVTYDADAVIGGMIGGVGQRMLAGVARRTAAEFFAAVDRDLAGLAPVSAEPGFRDDRSAVSSTAGPGATAGSTATAGGGAAALGAVGRRAVFESEAPPRPGGFAAGVLAGAAAALVGAVIGGWLSRQRRDR